MICLLEISLAPQQPHRLTSSYTAVCGLFSHVHHPSTIQHCIRRDSSLGPSSIFRSRIATTPLPFPSSTHTHTFSFSSRRSLDPIRLRNEHRRPLLPSQTGSMPLHIDRASLRPGSPLFIASHSVLVASPMASFSLPITFILSFLPTRRWVTPRFVFGKENLR